MAAVSELPWEELHGNLRAFISRRVRNQADVDDLVQRVLLQIVRGLASLRDAERLHPGCIARPETSLWTTTGRQPVDARSPAAEPRTWRRQVRRLRRTPRTMSEPLFRSWTAA